MRNVTRNLLLLLTCFTLVFVTIGSGTLVAEAATASTYVKATIHKDRVPEGTTAIEITYSVNGKGIGTWPGKPTKEGWLWSYRGTGYTFTANNIKATNNTLSVKVCTRKNFDIPKCFPTKSITGLTQKQVQNIDQLIYKVDQNGSVTLTKK